MAADVDDRPGRAVRVFTYLLLAVGCGTGGAVLVLQGPVLLGFSAAWTTSTTVLGGLGILVATAVFVQALQSDDPAGALALLELELSLAFGLFVGYLWYLLTAFPATLSGPGVRYVLGGLLVAAAAFWALQRADLAVFE